MTYAADGLRASSQEGANTTRFVWDGQNYLLETDNAGITQVVYTNTVHPYGDLISQRRAGTSSFYLFDALGSTDRLTDAGQTITDSYILDAWGNPVSSTGSTTNAFRFVGRLGYANASTLGLYYVRDRWYGAPQGTWLSADRIAADINLYRYCGNEPTNAVDPTGLEDYSVDTKTDGCSITLYVGHNVSVQKRLEMLYPGFSTGGTKIPASACILGVCCGFRYRPQDNQKISPRVRGSSKTCSLQWFLQEYYLANSIPAPALLPLREITEWLVGRKSVTAALDSARKARESLCGGQVPSGDPNAKCPKCDTVTIHIECDAAATEQFGTPPCGSFEIQPCRPPGF